MAGTVKRALADQDTVKPSVRGEVKAALSSREEVQPKKSRGKVRSAMGRKSTR